MCIGASFAAGTAPGPQWPAASPALPTREGIRGPDLPGAALRGEEILRRELGALRAWHLRNIVQAYALTDEHRVDLEALGEPELVELIVEATRDRPAGAPEPAAHV